MQRKNNKGEKEAFLHQEKIANYGSTLREEGTELETINVRKRNSKTDTPSKDKYQEMLNSEKNNIDDFTLEDVVKKSSLISEDPETQANNILSAFNKRVVKGQETFIKSYLFGEWVQPDEFLLGACNSIPELSLYDGAMKIRRQWNINPAINTELLGRPKQADLFYGAYGSYVVNVPVNKYAKAWSGNIPVILGSGPHVIHDTNFKFDKNDLVDQSDLFINHGFINIIRVPAGKIAKVWIGSEPILLESRKAPYVFTSPQFRLVKKLKEDIFYDATDELITHGSIKRLMPHSGRVAITYNCGMVEVIPANPDKQPIIIDSPLHEVSGFLDTNVQHFVFPSKKKQKEQLESNKSDNPAEINNFVFTTKESLKITAKIFVAFGIMDAKTTLRLLSTQERIIEFVENTAVVEMGKAIQSLSSRDFLNRSFQEAVHDKMSKILESYGITLTFFNVETPRVLDRVIEQKLAEGATMTAEENTKEAVLEIKSRNDAADANRLANAARIKQKQINEAVVSVATAGFDAAKIDGEAIVTRAKAEVEAEGLKAALYNSNPVLVELKKMEMITKAIEKSNFIMPCPTQPLSLVMDPKTYDSPLTFFGNRSDRRAAEHAPIFEKESTENQSLHH